MNPILAAMYNSSTPTDYGGNDSPEMPVHMDTETLGPQDQLQNLIQL